jgi:RHS repeat-associated protein
LFSISNNGVPIEYEYDANGNITKIIEDGRENLYYYNELNELIQEDIDNSSKSILYSYDLGGNIIGKTEIIYGNGEPGSTITYEYDDTWKDKLKSYNGKLITYDEIGNPLTYDGYTYSWEEGRRLKSIIGNGQNISYKYNDVGIRTEKNVDGVITKYYLSGDKVILEDNGTDKLYYSYDSFNNLISMNLNGDEYYYIRNGQGDIIGLFDDSGTEVVRYYYDSWGKLISIEGTLKDTVGVKNPYRYRGYRYDTETGLYYLQSRYYNPVWGRFINADGFLGIHGMLLSHNLFAYCQNNAVNNSDSSGCFFDIFLDIAFIAISIIGVAKNPSSRTAWLALAADVVFAAIPGATGGGAMVRAASKVEKVAEIAKLTDKGSDVAKGVTNTTGSYRQLVNAGKKDAHHIIQDAAMREISNYNRFDAPAIQLYGPATLKGTPHNIATSIQRQAGGGTYGAERRIGYKALRRAGLSVSDAKNAIRGADRYFMGELRLTLDSITRIPGNR